MVLEKFVELKDVWVVDLLKNRDLAKEFLLLVLLEVLLVDYLDCPQRFGFFVQTLAHFAVGP